MAYGQKLLLAVGCSLATLLAGAGRANAADQPANAASDEEIVVTARKRAELLSDVPTSVTEVTGASLQQIGAAKLDDYVARIPALTASNVSMIGSTQLTLRGITTGPGGNPTVGIYIDDSPYGPSNGTGGFNVPDLDPQDLSRVEVLRGPQGTLYGAGAMGGLLRYITAEPDPSHFFGRVQLNGSTVDGGGEGYGVRAAANVPINDSVALRISGYDRKDPGYIDNVLTGLSDINDTKFYGGRASLGWRVNDDWKVRLSALYQHQKGAGPIVDFSPVTFEPLYGKLKQSDAIDTNIFSRNLGAYSLGMEGQLGDFATLTSVTTYNHIRLKLNLDFTPFYGPFIAFAFGIPNVGVALNNGPVDTDKFVQELRLASVGDGKFSWQIGAFYTREHTDSESSTSTFDQVTGTPVTGIPQLTASTATTKFREAAVFGDITYRFSPAFDVTAGIRYSHNKMHTVGTVSGLFVGPPRTNDVRSDDDSVTYLVNPRFHLNDDTMIYARFATGYRPGGPNGGLFGTPLSYGPDTVTNYEVGLKSSLFDRKVTIDLSAYWIDWKDIQVQQTDPANAVSYITNGGKAVSRGVDFSGTWRPAAGLQLFANLAFQDAYVSSDFPPLGAVAHKGDPLPLTPRWSWSVGGDYSFPLSGNKWQGLVGADWNHVGDRPGAFPNPGALRFVHPSYDVFNLRAGVTDDRWTFMIYARNLANDHGQTSEVNFGSFTRVTVIQPRTFEISLSRTF